MSSHTGDTGELSNIFILSKRIFSHSKLSTALPGVTLADVGQDTGLQRMIKSEEEIAVTKISAAAADIGGEACRAALQREGVMEWEVDI